MGAFFGMVPPLPPDASQWEILHHRKFEQAQTRSMNRMFWFTVASLGLFMALWIYAGIRLVLA